MPMPVSAVACTNASPDPSERSTKPYVLLRSYDFTLPKTGRAPGFLVSCFDNFRGGLGNAIQLGRVILFEWTRQSQADRINFAARYPFAPSGAGHLPATLSRLLPAMDIGGDKDERHRPLVFHPVRPRTKFSEYLTRPKLLRRAIVMMVGENPGKNIDDRRVALMAVEPDMAARRYDGATDPQLTIVDAVDFLGQIDRGKYRLLNPFVIGGRGILSKGKTGEEDGDPGQ
jgi:hypothetical protein